MQEIKKKYVDSGFFIETFKIRFFCLNIRNEFTLFSKWYVKQLKQNQISTCVIEDMLIFEKVIYTAMRAFFYN